MTDRTDLARELRDLYDHVWAQHHRSDPVEHALLAVYDRGRAAAATECAESVGLPVCPRVDCTATGCHDHDKGDGEATSCRGEGCTHLATLNYTPCYSPRPAQTDTHTGSRSEPVDPASLRVGDRIEVVWAGVVEEVRKTDLMLREDDGHLAHFTFKGDTFRLISRAPEPEDPRVAVVHAWIDDGCIDVAEGEIADLLARLDAIGGERAC